MSRLNKITFLIVCFLAILFVYHLPLQAQQEKIRIGVMPASEFYHVDKVGNLSGYAYDYLQEVAKYTGWQYEYIEGSWQENLLRLQRGEIDLIGMAPYHDDLANSVLYAGQPSSTISAALYAKINNDALHYEDYNSFNGLTIGLIDSSPHNKSFYEFCALHRLSTKNISYQTIPDLLHALNTAQVDAIVSIDTINTPEIKAIASLSNRPYYFITAKNQTALMQQFQEAQNRLTLTQPHYEALLHQKYFKTPVTAFTNEEIAYIQSRRNNPLTVVYAPDWAPIEFYNTQTQKAEGLSIDILEYIANYSGLNFNFIKPASFSEALRMIENNEVDLLSANDYDTDPAKRRFILTDTYMSIPAVTVKRKRPITRVAPIIVLPKNFATTSKYHQFIDNETQILYVDTVEECFDAIASDRADITYTNSYIADSFLHSYKYSNLTASRVDYRDDKLHIALAPTADPRLLSILNKSIASISPKKLDAMILDNALKQIPQTHLISLSHHYAKEITIAVMITCFIVILVLAYFINIKNNYNKKIEQIAFIDQLTGMWNYNKFKIKAEEKLKKYPDNRYAILFLDTIKFKYINDSFGFNVGDKALNHIAQTLLQNIAPGDLFARFSVDQFILLIRYQKKQDILSTVNSLFTKLQTFKITDTDFYTLNFSCGISLVEATKMSPPDLYPAIEQALMAQRTLKNNLGSSYVFYNDAYREQIIKEKNIEDIMESALENHEFTVFYQPKYLLATAEISGAEALVRWKRPNHEMFYPDEFIPLFEKNGFITKLDFYMIKRVCNEMSAWLKDGKKALPISINLSRIHINNPIFAAQLQQIVEQYNIPHHLIELEITESAFIENVEKLRDFIISLKALDFVVSMDDFGSGYSSLNLLKKLPFDILKLDKDFLQTECSTDREKIIITSIVNMSKQLNISVVAEGVETAEQADFLQEIKCDAAQGYLFSHPIELSEFLAKI